MYSPLNQSVIIRSYSSCDSDREKYTGRLTFKRKYQVDVRKFKMINARKKKRTI